MRTKLTKPLTYLLFQLLFFMAPNYSFAGDDFDSSIVSFPTSHKMHVLSGVDQVFELTEIDYEPKYKIEYISSIMESRSNKVENTLISRFSAIATQDIEWWKKEWALETEGDKSLDMLVNSANGLDAAMNRWKNISIYYNIFLTKKIIYKKYVIILYELTPKDKSNNGLILPVVLKTMGVKGWKVTSDLKRSLLFKYMPWKSKQYSVVEKDSLWVLEE